jgi:hypothetical protein
MLTTGARHPYKIDEKYLRSRKVDTLGDERKGSVEGEGEGAGATFDPREISGYKLKELIWTDWRSEWEPRPASPSSIRLIILGRLVEDKAALKGMSSMAACACVWACMVLGLHRANVLVEISRSSWIRRMSCT